MDKEQHANGIKSSIDDILGASTLLKTKKKSEEDQHKSIFIKTIQTLEEIEIRGMILGNDLQLDFLSYDEKFYTVIDALFSIAFNKEACELIFFYIYERIGPDGSVNEIADMNGTIIPLTSPDDLWELVKQVQDKSGKAKKKA
jgi:hypothetical protein